MDGLDLAVETGSKRLSGFSNRRAPKRRLTRFAPFLLSVVLPTLVTGVYFYGFAADQYVSEARFLVRGPTQQSPGALSSLLQTAGVARADEDTYAVQDYMVSRDALAELLQQADVKSIFTRPEADLLSRFTSWTSRGPFEHLFKYYTRHVDVQMDSGSGVSVLTVDTFRPADSHLLAADLMAGAERLVNRMNDRQREDTLRQSRAEVQRAEQRVQDLTRSIADFRNKEGLIDPTKQSTTMLAAIDRLQTKLVGVKLELAALQPSSPLLPSTRERAAALQAQIDHANAEVAGTGRSMVPKIREFDMLSLEREFAEKQLASATSSLEAARIAADRQTLYLEPIVQPDTPDYPEYPKRIKDILVTFFSLCGIYVTAALLIAGAKEHKLV